MKPFAQKIGRIDCPRCRSAKCDVIIRGVIHKNGRIKSAIYQRESCTLCFYEAHTKELTPDQILKVEQKLSTINMQAKKMYEIVSSRTIGDQTWHFIKWTGTWRSDAMSELTKALDESCQSVRPDPQEDGETIRESGMHLDKSTSPYRLFIRADFMKDFEDVITQPIFQESFTQKARVPQETIDAIRDAFADSDAG